jgi:hypothetical protein
VVIYPKVLFGFYRRKIYCLARLTSDLKNPDDLSGKRDLIFRFRTENRTQRVGGVGMSGLKRERERERGELSEK